MNKRFLFLLAGLFASAQIISAQPAASTPTGSESGFVGKVIETTNAASYTYVRVDTGSNKLWAATTQFAVKVGDTVAVGAGVPMTGYHSKSLNRDFDVVYFTGRISVGGVGNAAGGMPGFAGRASAH